MNGEKEEETGMNWMMKGMEKRMEKMKERNWEKEDGRK